MTRINMTQLIINTSQFKNEHSFNTALMFALALRYDKNLPTELKQAMEHRFSQK